MCIKYLFITVLIHFSYFPNGGNSQRPAEKACEEIISSYEPGLGNYIVSGTKAALGEFPHMVGLAIELPNGTTIYYCGGTLISDTFVLTAAHCVDTFDPDLPITVRAGSLDVGNAEFNPDTDVKIAARFVHPQYDRTLKYDDLALLRLPEPIKKSATVNAICLETNDADPAGVLTVTGWGHTRSKDDICVQYPLVGFYSTLGRIWGGDTCILNPSPHGHPSRGQRSEELLKANVEAVSLTKCQKAYKRFTNSLPRGILKEQLCAGDPKGTHQDACQGDSGGPLIVAAKDGRSKLVGVTSFGRGCGTRIPGVYARVSSYIDWIEGIVWPN